MKGVKHSSYLWVADNNWINFAEKWMCFDALVADSQSAGFSPIYHSPFICCCQTFPQPPFQGRLIKQLFNKTKRHLHSQRTEQGFTAQGGESWDEYQLTLWHAVFPRWEVWHSIKKIQLTLFAAFRSVRQAGIHRATASALAHSLPISKKRLNLAGLDFSAGSLPALLCLLQLNSHLHCCWRLLNTFAFLLHFPNVP